MVVQMKWYFKENLWLVISTREPLSDLLSIPVAVHYCYRNAQSVSFQ